MYYDTAGVAECLELLDDQNPRARRTGLRRLADSASMSLIPQIRRATLDSDPLVAFEAGRTLRKILARGLGVELRGEAEDTHVGRANSSELRRAGLEVLLPYSERLGSLVQSADLGVARVGVQALGKIGDIRCVSSLVPVLEREDIAAEAAVALASIGEESCLDLLLSLLDSQDPRLVQHAVYAVGAFPCPRVENALERMLGHADGGVRSDTVLVLGSVRGFGAIAPIRPLLDDTDDRVVMKALEVTVAFDPTFLLDFAVPRFDRFSGRLRATVAALTGECPPSEQAACLLARALDDDDSRVRANAVEAVGALSLSRDRKAELLQRVYRDRNNRVMANLAVVLAASDIVESLKILQAMLNSKDKWERASAVFAAGFIAEEKVAMWLANNLPLEEDPDVLGNAVRSLGRQGGVEILERMFQSLRHYNEAVRAGAARVLGALAARGVGRVATREALLRRLDDEGAPSVVTSILTSLRPLVDPSQVRRISKCLRSTSFPVQAAAIGLLDTIGTMEILPFVEPFIFSLDDRVKAAATLALWKQGHLDVIHVLGQMLDQDDEEEVASAAYAIGEIGLTLYQLDNDARAFLLRSALAARRCRSADVIVNVSAAECDMGDDGSVLERVAPALGLLIQGAVNECGESLRAVLTDNPDDGFVHYLLGVVCRQLDDLEAAGEHFSCAMVAEPDFINVRLELAALYQRKGALEAALEQFVAAARIRCRVIESLAQLAESLLPKGCLESASLTVRALLDVSSRDCRLHHRLGEHLLRVDCVGDALPHLIFAFIAEPCDVATRRLLMEAYDRRPCARALAALMSLEEPTK